METLVTPDGVLVSDLWIDQPSALQDVQVRARDEGLDAEASKTAADVIVKGYGVLDLGLRPSIYAEADEQIDGIWRDRPSDVAYGGSVGALTGDFALSDVPREYSRSDPPMYRLCCAHTHSPALDEIYFNERLHKEVSFLFGEPCIAVQTLYFEYGSRQGQHRDTSVVSFDPLCHLLAAWVALEDIEEGSGELEYIPGSHRIENFFYPDGSIIWRDEYGFEAFYEMDQGIRRAAGRHQLQPERFLAKRGQALIWHHSLSHGGGTVTKPWRTRKSLVIHFTTLSDFTRRNHQLIYRDGESGEYWTFADSSTEVIERNGCFASGSVIAGWRDRPLPPAKRAAPNDAVPVHSFTGQESDVFQCTAEIEGWVDSIRIHDDHGGIAVAGWALDLRDRSPAAHIVLMAGETLIASWPTGSLRNDVAEAHGTKNAGYAGFYKVLSAETLAGKTRLRIFAVDRSGGFAELNYADQACEYLATAKQAVDAAENTLPPT